MRFWPVNEINELVSGMPAPQFGDESSEGEDQSWFKVQAVPVFRFDRYKMFSRTASTTPAGTRTPGLEHIAGKLQTVRKFRYEISCPCNAILRED
jgi:hypothetical protein